MEEEFENVAENWRGTKIEDICKGKGPWSFTVPSVTHSKYHFVLYELPVSLQTAPKPHNSMNKSHWDDEHVKMPYSEKNLFSYTEGNADIIEERWKIIEETFTTPITSSEEFESALNKYNTFLPKFDALHYFLNQQIDSEESEMFFHSLLPKIVALALQLPQLLPSGIPLLKRNLNRSLSLSQQQISCLLANAFLCTFPWKKNVAATYPGLNFGSLYSASQRPGRLECICQKLRSICNYFRRVTDTVPLGVVTFERKIIPKKNMPRWDTLNTNLGNTKIHITCKGTIEDNGLGFLQVDFANKNIGGGVLRYGCVQEEIRFMICPELIVGRLFIEQLGNGEAVVITGAERYNNYTGYGESFQWSGDHEDQTPFDIYGRRKTAICVIDAIRFNNSQEQFQSSLILRELNKAFVGFSSHEKVNLAPVATGNWGCGAFNGSKQLKTLVQLMACSASGRDLVYYTFDDEELMEHFYSINLFIANRQITIAQLWKFLGQFKLRNLEENQLYSFIQQAYFDSRKQPSISNFFGKSSSTSSLPSCSTTLPELSQQSDEAVEFLSSSPSSSEDIIPSSQPDSPPPARNFIRLKAQRKKDDMDNKDILSKLPKTDISAIFDLLDNNGNNSNQSSGTLKKENQINNSGSSSSSFCLFDHYLIPKDDILEEVIVEKSPSKSFNTSISNSSTQVKNKITNYFTKI